MDVSWWVAIRMPRVSDPLQYLPKVDDEACIGGEGQKRQRSGGSGCLATRLQVCSCRRSA